MRIIGIDPGLASTGYGVIDTDGRRSVLVECGTVKTSARESMPERLRAIHRELTDVVKRTKPTAVAIEGLYFVQNITSGIAVAQGRGVAILAAVDAIAESLGVEPEMGEYTPMQIKQAVVGYGKASKMQVAQMVRTILRLDDMKATGTSHAADALAAALCHAHTSGFAKAAVRAKLEHEMRSLPTRGKIRTSNDSASGKDDSDARRTAAKALLSQMRTKSRRGGRRKA